MCLVNCSKKKTSTMEKPYNSKKVSLDLYVSKSCILSVFLQTYIFVYRNENHQDTLNRYLINRYLINRYLINR